MSRLESHIHLKPGRLHIWLETFLAQSTQWRCTKASSVEGRPIYILQAGSRPENIIIWSQMHGNEATATYSLTDILLYLEEDSQLFRNLLNHYSIVVVPMLNPDGAERFTRYNALGSDLNREGLRTISPETNVLKSLLARNAAFAFNLHDQRTFYSAGSAPTPATLSLLAPSTKTMQGEEARLRAIRLISDAVEHFGAEDRKFIARFSDEYYPQAMGEWCTDRGISTILIECGGFLADFHRVRAREMCFQFLKYAMLKLSHPTEMTSTAYFSLPYNGQMLRDVLLRNVRMRTPDGMRTVDLGFTAVYHPSDDMWKWQLEEVGDLQLKFGYIDIDLIQEDPIDFYHWKPTHFYTHQDLPKTWHQWFTTT